jgi:KUP system potassium uptake protein
MARVETEGPGRNGRPTLHEAAHKLDLDESALGGQSVQTATKVGQRRVLYEAAHKLQTPEELPEAEKPAPRVFETERDVVSTASRAALALGALGVVYGDIGTSPLYTEQTIFSSYRATAHVTPAGVYGVASLIFWALMVMVSIKYAGFIMRAHNRGDGGIMALAALLQRHRVVTGAALVTLGIFGAGLFFGDGIITPTISVLGALQGIQVATPTLVHAVVPLSVAILLGLFVLQRYGSGTIGWLFGPVMLVWFVLIGLFGLAQVARDPAVLQGLSPTWAVRFFVDHGVYAYLMLGGVVLAVTGAEALYADRGHFGAKAIRLGWFGLVLPALTLSYLGQGAWIVHHPAAGHASGFNPFYQMIPRWSLWPMVVLATVATIIASQAVISGSFSVAKQAIQLGFLPRLKVLHTSSTEGQIYVPIVNWGLCIGVLALTLVFRSATRLGDIYGVAVTGTFILNTVLFLAVARLLWRRPRLRLAPLALLFLTVEVAFFSANIAKIEHGAWLPLAIGLVVSIIMITWRRGQVIVTRNRAKQEGSLEEFLEGVAAMDPPVCRVPGTAIFPSPDKATTPLALRATVEHEHVLHDKLVIVSIERVSVPHVNRDDRFVLSTVGEGLFRVFHVVDRVGYRDRQSIPDSLALARKMGLLERNLDLEHASYFVSRITITPTDEPDMRRWRKDLFVALARNAASPIDAFGLPSERTVTIGSQVPV